MRQPNGRFVPGTTGNPSGRAKIDLDMRSALEAASLAAAQRLVELVKSEDERLALVAANVILDRTLGKAPASIELTSASAEADWDRIQKAWASLTVEHLRAVHDSARVHDLRDIPAEALEAVLIFGGRWPPIRRP
jgi:hypothetical protein